MPTFMVVYILKPGIGFELHNLHFTSPSLHFYFILFSFSSFLFTPQTLPGTTPSPVELLSPVTTSLVATPPSLLSPVVDFTAIVFSLSLDPTDGFTNIPLTESNFKLQKPYDIPLEQRYSFQNGVHRLWVYADDKPYDPSSPTQPRTEIRILGLDCSSGVRQFEGYAFVRNGTSGATIAQNYGAANDPKGTTILLRIFNGDMRYYSHDLVTTDLYDKWFRLNIIHNVDEGIVKVFINGSKKFGAKDRGPGDLLYESRWKDIEIFKKCN